MRLSTEARQELEVLLDGGIPPEVEELWENSPEVRAVYGLLGRYKLGTPYPEVVAGLLDQVKRIFNISSRDDCLDVVEFWEPSQVRAMTEKVFRGLDDRLRDIVRHDEAGTTYIIARSNDSRNHGVFVLPQQEVAGVDYDVPLALFAAVAGHLLSVAKYTDELTKLAYTDALTGVYNRRKFDEDLSACLSRAEQERKPFSLLAVDLNDFKPVNDEHGHDTGDKTLQAVARAMEAAIGRATRSTDQVYRVGGDEFSVVLYGAAFQQAVVVGERIRRGVENIQTVLGTDGDPLSITCSIGVASFPEHTSSLSAQSSPAGISHLADTALYAAKEAGKNCVVIYQPKP